MMIADKHDDSYREILTKYYGKEIGRVVGGGLDRAGGCYYGDVQNEAIHFYEQNKTSLLSVGMDERKQIIADFVQQNTRNHKYSDLLDT